VTWLEHAGGRVSVAEQPDGRRLVSVHTAPGTFVARRECTTAYPVALIEQILQVKSPGYLCDEIDRDEDPNYVELYLRHSLLGYVPAEDFRGARLLDFGSGSGASTVILARMFPGAEIVSVELDSDLIRIAKMRAEHHRLSNLTFLQSPTPEQLPANLGTFKFINLGAVYEHLLPAERRRIPAQLWSVLEVGGVVFVNQLPYRFYPIEAHTTGLPLLNYLPDRWTHAAATRLSPRIRPAASWAELLRAGIRGGTEPAVRRDLLRGGGEARLVEPAMMGFRDHADLWFAYSSQIRPHPAKRAMRGTFRAISRLVGTPVAPALDLAFQKLA
jgi:2-polyprenyl-3-methyl-5-hydroxy-6-metoxy-1,4-benzoquinol methylase